MTDDDIPPELASASLTRAKEAAQRVRSHARWMTTYLGVFSIGFAAVTLAVGLVQPRPVRILVFVAWGILVLATVAWARRRPAAIRGASGRATRYWVVTISLYAVAIAAGTPHLTGHVWYWVPAAIAVALPLTIGALRERRA
jgi:hypothetical protein